MSSKTRYFIKENYYFDFDQDNQLRIAGPGNHLFLGWTFPEDLKIVLDEYSYDDNLLNIKLVIPTNTLKIHCPIVADMRSVRDSVEGKKPKVLFKDLVDEGREDLMPQIINIFEDNGKIKVELKNIYKDVFEEEVEYYYGEKLYFKDYYKVNYLNNYLEIINPNEGEIRISLSSITNIVSSSQIESLYEAKPPLDSKYYSEFILNLYNESADFIEHLIKNNKTSSFEYGTIFPRDWMESADLGSDDFTKDVINYMYLKAMENISEHGEGWHENAIGQYKSKIKGQGDIIDRKMIDIEPHYILGLKYVSPQFLLDPDVAIKFKKIGEYIVRQADENELISFKKHLEDYYQVGNWRDSVYAFPNQQPPVSPYDVNCVFYPNALKIIRDYNSLFKIVDEKLDMLIQKWDGQKDKYRLYHPYNITGYCIALHGRKNKPMPISNLDEAYDMFYGNPSLNDVDSFSKKIINSGYFYTPVGPILVASDEEEFTTSHYHGKVIWPKQAAFAVAGLTRQFKIGLSQVWPEELLNQIKESVIKTCEACFRGWEELEFVPELYYYDEKLDRARLYTDQDEVEAQMSNIQLWSSVAVRRIVSDYNYIKTI